MSRLLKEIAAKQIEAARCLWPVPYSPILDVESKIDQQRFEQSFRYEVVATFGWRAVVARPSNIQEVVRSAREAVRDFVFGEFRPQILEIQRLLWERDIDTAIERMAELERSMFHD